MDVKGKTALVTGGTAGIGREIARLLSARGARVIIVGRSASCEIDWAGQQFPDVVGLAADLESPSEQERVIIEVRERWPALAILVNNAGLQVNLPAKGIGDDGKLPAFRREIQLNLTAPIALSFGLMPVLAAQPEAAIINISSGLAFAPKRTAPVYSATKAGLRAFTTALRYRCEDAAPTIRVIDAVMALADTQMTHGRGGRKMTARDAAAEVVRGLECGRPDLKIGSIKILAALNRLSPTLARRILRNAP